MVATMLHSIATGNILPASIPLVCVDINPATVTKLADRGSAQAMGIITDIGLFLEQLARELVPGRSDERRPARARRPELARARARRPLRVSTGTAAHQVGGADDAGLRAELGDDHPRAGPEAAAGQRPLQPVPRRRQHHLAEHAHAAADDHDLRVEDGGEVGDALPEPDADLGDAAPAPAGRRRRRRGRRPRR